LEPFTVISENRLAALEADSNTYSFAVLKDGNASVTVTLLFRRAFIDLLDQKGAEPTLITKRKALPKWPEALHYF